MTWSSCCRSRWIKINDGGDLENHLHITTHQQREEKKDLLKFETGRFVGH